jgi:hypothetical protein
MHDVIRNAYTQPLVLTYSLYEVTNTDYEKYELVIKQNLVSLNKQLNSVLALYLLTIYKKGEITKAQFNEAMANAPSEYLDEKGEIKTRMPKSEQQTGSGSQDIYKELGIE